MSRFLLSIILSCIALCAYAQSDDFAPETPSAEMPALEIVSAEVVNVGSSFAEIMVEFSEVELPDGVGLFALATNGKTGTKAKTEVYATSHVSIFVDGLEELTDYTYSILLQAEDEDFSVLGVSESITVSFTTLYDDGVDDILDDERCARYFTLSGIETLNPRHGEIYIRVIGNKARKIIY